MSMNDFAGLVAGLPGTSTTGADPEVVNAIQFWLQQGNLDMARRIAAANTPGTDVPTAVITPAQAVAANLPNDPGVIAQVGGLPGPSAPPAPAAPAGPTNDQQSALDILKSTLQDYGLDSLGDWAWNLVQKWGTSISPDLFNAEVRKTPEYQNRFAGIFMREKAGLPPMSATEYVGYEKQANDMYRAAGLPSGFYDSPQAIANFIGRGVGLPELKARIDDNMVAAYQSPPETLDALHRLYGVTPGGLTAYWADAGVAEPLLHQRFLSAQLAGTAAQTGYGALDQTQAERLAVLGVTQGQAQQGFSQLGQQSELFRPLTGAEGAIGTDEQLAAAFGGDAAAQADVRRRQAARVAVFGAGGGVSQSSQGLSGVGAAQQ